MDLIKHHVRQKRYRDSHKEYLRAYRARNRERLKALNEDWIGRNLARVLWGAIKKRAKQRGIPFNIEVEDIVIPKPCPALGIPLKRGKGVQCDSSPTVDRTIPELGYVKGNVRVISALANRIKTNATTEQVELVAQWLRRDEA